MTKHTDSSRSTDSDSSAPNSPEATRLRGERAEERTARESRSAELAQVRLLAKLDELSEKLCKCEPDRDCDWCDKLAAINADIEDSLSECSRLASRVEELENVLRKVMKLRSYKTPSDVYEHMPWQELRDVLAGAHAEEKPQDV